jgi:uncharacterized membrane protein HdeD (DUF308 family)
MVIQNSAAPQFMQEFHEHRGTVFIEGVLLVLVGFVAIAVPFVAGILTAVLVGSLLIFVGLLGLWTSWSMRRVKGNGWAMLSSAVALIAGASLLAWPIGGLISLTLMLGAYLTVDGVTTIALAMQHRRAKTRNWVWLLGSGILDLLLATAIVMLLPSISVWLVGVIVGVDLSFAGISLIAMGWPAKAQVVRLGALH